MRIGIVQYGVLHDRFEDLRSGGIETYYAQRYSVDFVADLSEEVEFIGVCGVLGENRTESALSDSLHSVCVPLADGAVNAPAVIEYLEKWRLDKLILQAPIRPILSWALRGNIDTLPLLADSFEERSLRHRFRAFRLAQLLSNPAIRAVGNHNIPSCLSLKRIGVDAAKVYPWDWPHQIRPEQNPAKALTDGPAQLVYVGTLASQKGVGECIEAGRILRDQGLSFEMTLIGAGSFTQTAMKLISDHDLSAHVKLAGRLSHEEVVNHLKAATISMAPSWHNYPEGLPMTIYEALATRTPLVLSDHPMFRLYFANTPAAKMAPERDAQALAVAIKSLLSDRDAYARASTASEALWNRVKCDLTWGELINAWLNTDGKDLSAIRSYALDNVSEQLPEL